MNTAAERLAAWLRNDCINRQECFEAIAAARVQENERCVQALEALWHSNDDSTKKCINAIRALINTGIQRR